MPFENSISVIIPAFNEEGNLSEAVSSVNCAAKNLFSKYEIIIINDASTDKTGEIANKLAQENPNIIVIHNVENMGMGYNYRHGVSIATMEFVGLVPGDNELVDESIVDIFKCVGKADMVLPYHSNSDVRPISRQLLSSAFTIILNILFGHKLKYYNGPAVHKRCLINHINLSANGFAYQAEILMKLLRQGCSYIEVGMKTRNRKHGHSKALYPKSIINVFISIARLYCDINLNRNKGI
jgi:dolichol-phosphate mannosyltransferase